MKTGSKFLPLALAVAHTLVGCAGALPEDDIISTEPTSATAAPTATPTEPEVASQASALIAAPICSLLAETANGSPGPILEELRNALVGRRVDVGVRDDKYVEVTGVESVSFSGCRLKTRVNLLLNRPGIRENARGYADVSGTLYAGRERVLHSQHGWITRDRACLRNMSTDNVTLSNTAGIGERIFERHANRQDGDCFSSGQLWSSVESGIALANAFGAGLPPLEYEALPQRRLDGWVHGAIGEKWRALGGDGFFGEPLDIERPTVDGVGRRQRFANADISWHPSTGAWSVLGDIRSKWHALGAESWGYPVTDERGTPDKVGRYNHFVVHNHDDRSIYWTPQTGAVGIRGAIRQTWANQGWETGRLRYPTKDEGPVGNLHGQYFQGGVVVWDGSKWAVVTGL